MSGSLLDSADVEVAQQAPVEQTEEVAQVLAAPEEDTGTPAIVEETQHEEHAPKVEKRIHDTSDAISREREELKKLQREFHELRGEKKAIQEMLQNKQSNVDPEEQRLAREQFLEEIDANPSKAVEYFENMLAAQEASFQQRLEQERREITALKSNSDPLVQQYNEVLNKISDNPIFEGLTRQQMAQVADTIISASGQQAQQTGVRPPASVKGGGRPVKTAQPTNSVLPPGYLQSLGVIDDDVTGTLLGGNHK